MMKYNKAFVLVVMALFSVCLLSVQRSYAAMPVVSDSRIKTFVYSDSEVFQVVLHYGYQSNIEFSKDEEVDTISMGNSYSWQVTPVGNRIFLKPLEPEAHTNMTVITNKHTYQFDISSRSPEDAGADDQLVYVVRFYYPDQEDFDAPPTANGRRKLMPDTFHAKAGYNFDYSLSGPDDFAPLKVFDDGHKTYFQFPDNNANIPYIFALSADRSEQRLAFSREGEYIVVERVGAQFVLRLNNQIVCVFNERLDPGSKTSSMRSGAGGR